MSATGAGVDTAGGWWWWSPQVAVPPVSAVPVLDGGGRGHRGHIVGWWRWPESQLRLTTDLSLSL